MPRAVLDSVREYQHEMDVVSAFIDNCCIEGGSVAAKTLFAAYLKWAENNNEHRMSNTKFGMEMNKRFEKIHTKTGWIYNGLSLLSEY